MGNCVSVQAHFWGTVTQLPSTRCVTMTEVGRKGSFPKGSVGWMGEDMDSRNDLYHMNSMKLVIPLH